MAKQQSSQKQPTAPQSAVAAPIPFLQPRAFGETSEATKDAAQPDLQAQIDQASTFGHSLARINTRPLSHLPIQPKLTIGKVGDPYEQEADRVAAQVVQQINQSATTPGKASVQRQAIGEENELQRKPDIQRRADVGGMAASSNLESSINQARGGGQGLSDSIRQPMEQAFGADFSSVRVHTDSQSDQLSRSINAQAFTTKNDIFFSSGTYNPGDRGGQELLAHELTHVVQQNNMNTLQSKIQRADGDKKPSIPMPKGLPTLKFFQKTTDRGLAHRREEEMKKVDEWLKYVSFAKTVDEQKHALGELRKACGAALLKVPQLKYHLESLSTKCEEALGTQAQPVLPPTDKANYGNAEQVSEMFQGGLDSRGGFGSVGDSDDVHKTENADKVGADYVETADVLSGLHGIYSGYKGFKEADGLGGKFVAGGTMAQGGGQTVNGGLKIAKVAGASAKVGELGSAFGDGAEGFSQLISGVDNLVGLCKGWEGLTKAEVAQSTLTLGGNISSTAQAGVKTAHAAIKMGADASPVLGTVAAGLGILTGTIQLVQGGFTVYKGWSAKKEILQAEAGMNRMIGDVGTKIGAAEEKFKVARQEYTVAVLTKIEKGKLEQDLKEAQETLKIVKNTLIEMEKAQEAFAPGLAALKKVQNQHMKDGAMKMAGGALGIVSGALILSGVGAPIAIAIGALGGLLALGNASVGLARNRKATTLSRIAEYLDTNGKPVATRTPVEYGDMQNRVYKCYYNYLPQVLKQEEPMGLSKTKFTHIKHFTWSDKKTRAKDKEAVSINSVEAVKTLTDLEKQYHWIEVKDSTGKLTHRERPQGFAKIDHLFSASAHKSGQALTFSKQELADMIILLCQNSYKSGAFVNSAIKPMGGAEVDEGQLKEFGEITLKTILSVADVTPEKWISWLEESKDPSDASGLPDAGKLRAAVMKHI